MYSKIKTVSRLLIFCLVLSFSSTYSQQLAYPKTKKVNVTDTYFGTTVEDPYRWLEDDRSAETAEWVKEQNALTNSYLEKIPFRDSIRSKMKSYWSSLKYTPPFRCARSAGMEHLDDRVRLPVPNPPVQPPQSVPGFVILSGPLIVSFTFNKRINVGHLG